MGIYKEWKNDIENKIKGLNREEIIDKLPVFLQRCPKCNKLSLEFDPKTGKMHCTKCEFTEYFKILK